MAHLLGTTFRGWIGTATRFISGFTGQGWRLWKHKIANGVGRYKLEIDDLMVRGTMVIFELIISKIRAIKGALGITQACGKIKAVRFFENNYYVKIEDEMSFMADDFIRCQKFNTSSTALKGYWVKVSSINSDNEIVIPFTEFMQGSDVGESGFPEVGDDIVQFGNETNVARQSAIYLHADEGGIPAIDVLQGINSKTFEGCTKVKLGGFTDGLKNYFGLSCVNGLIRSVAEDGVTEMYKLRPDGSGFFAKGNIFWDVNGHGYLCKTTVNGQTKYAITWDENGITLGSNVTISWENLTTETQQKLTGDKTEFRYAAAITAPDLTNTERTPEGWSLTPPTLTEGQYLWMIFATIIGTDVLKSGTTWSAPVSISGNSPYQLLLSNVMASVTLDPDGTLNYDDATTEAKLYYGTQAVANVVYAIVLQSGVTAEITNGAISVTSVTAETTNLEITATLSGGVEVARAIFKVVKVKNAMYYQIIPSVHQISKRKDGTLSVDVVRFSVYRIVGSTRTEVTSVVGDKVKMMVKKDGNISVTVDAYLDHPAFFPVDINVVNNLSSILEAKLFPWTSWEDSAMLDRCTIPVLIDGNDGNPGADANLLPWVQEWDSNKTQIGEDFLISPKTFSGTKSAVDGSLTGVAFGKEVITIIENGVPVKKTGIFGIKDGVITFSVNGGGDVSGNGTFSAGGPNARIVLDPDEKGAVLYSQVLIDGVPRVLTLGRFGFDRTDLGLWDISTASVELYTYVNGVMHNSMRFSPYGFSMHQGNNTLLQAEYNGLNGDIRFNYPVVPTVVALEDIPIGASYVDAGNSYVVKVRYT